MFIKFEFGSEAIPYIESCLFMGKTLSKYFLRNHRIDKRKEIFAFLPPDTTFEQRVRFLEGSVINKPGTRQKTAEFIADFIRKGDDHCALFEHPNASPSDPWLKKSNIKFFTHKSNVYPFLTSQDTDLDIIKNTLSHIGSYPSIGFLAILPVNIQDKQEIEETALENFVAEFQYIMVGAYDEETVLFWCKE